MGKSRPSCTVFRGWCLALAMTVLVALQTTPAAARPVIEPTLQPRMTQTPPGQQLPVIVTLRDQADLTPFVAQAPRVRAMAAMERRSHREMLVRTLRNKAETSQMGIGRRLRDRGVEHVRSLWLINGLAFRATPELISELSALPEVESIRYDEIIQLPRITPAADSDLNTVEDNIDLINAPALWALGYTGQGVTVAIVDSGVDVQHPELGPRWRGGSNSWFNAVAENCGTVGVTCATSCDTNTTEPCDFIDAQNFAHGTGVAGVLVGGSAGGTAIGVAPGAQWIAAKIFDSNDGAPLSIIHQAFAWLLDPDGVPATDDAPDVVNGSWGYDPGNCSEEFGTALQAFKAAGIAVAFAAGNAGPAADTGTSPGNYPESFAVGSVGNSFFTQTTAISDFSSRGPSPCDGSIFPEVVAPGFVRTTDFSFGGLPLYTSIHGTSFATPHVAGVMALLLSAFPGTPVADLEGTLQQSATDLGTIGPDNDYGYGLVNALAAYQNLTGVPILGIHDPSPPENDRILDFGNVAPEESRDLVVTVTNVGDGILGISSAGGVAFAAPFFLGADNCSGAALGAGESCAVTVLFAPMTHEMFAGALEILSSSGTFTVALNGSGNSPPPAPSLVFPVNGAQGEALPVTLGWIPPVDADGDLVTDELMISTSPHFETAVPITLALVGGGAVLAGIGLAGCLGMLRRRFAIAGSAALLVLISCLVSCGGGGGGTAPVPLTADRTAVLTTLAPATTYYWKIVSSDGFGGSSQSATWSFTTR